MMSPLAGPDDVRAKVAKGRIVVLNFRGAGVNSGNQTPVFDAIRTAVLGTGHFEAPLFLGWGGGGAGGERGMLVYKGKTKSRNYSLQEISDFMVGIARRVSQSVGKQVTFASATLVQIPPSSEERQYTALVAKNAIVRRRVERVFGTRPPQMSWESVKTFDVRGLASASAEVVRSAALHAVAWIDKTLASARQMLDGAAQGVPGATQDAREQLRVAEQGAGAMESLLNLIPDSSVSGLGASPIPMGAAVVAALVALWQFFVKSEDATTRGENYCQRQARVTGERCSREDLEEIIRRYREEERESNPLNRIQDALEAPAKWAKYIAIGAAVLIGTNIALRAFSVYTVHRAVTSGTIQKNRKRASRRRKK